MLLLALSILGSIVLSGHRYFYCVHMDAASFDACCASSSSSSRADDELPSVEAAACCITRHLATPPPSILGWHVPNLRSPPATLPPTSAFADPPRPSPKADVPWLARAGPLLRPREQQLRLMVFLI
jgi:hypothetical protein